MTVAVGLTSATRRKLNPYVTGETTARETCAGYEIDVPKFVDAAEHV